MKIFDVTCASCLATYEVAEAVSMTGSPGRVHCKVCGEFLASWQEPKLRAYRLVVPSGHKYSHVPVPPSPAH